MSDLPFGYSYPEAMVYKDDAGDWKVMFLMEAGVWVPASDSWTSEELATEEAERSAVKVETVPSLPVALPMYEPSPDVLEQA